MKKSVFRKIFAIILTAVLMLTFTVSVSAQTPEESDAATKRSVKDVFSSQVDRDTDYNLSRLDLSTLPSYMEESLGFSELSDDQRPKSLTDLNVEDLYSFTTLNEDDTLTLYMFSEPVKYVDKETTAIKFIDNTIKAVETKLPVSSAELSKIGNSLYTAKSYTNTANFFKVDMPASINQGVSLSYEGKRFTLSPASASLSTAELKTATHRGMTEQTVEYRNALGTGVHLQYVPINSGVKENIVLDRYPGKNTFRFIFDAKGYYPIYTEGEAIPFADPSTDEIALILGQVDARDSYTGDETDGHFTLYNSLKLEDLKNGKYVLTVTVDNDFLTDPDTVYPVVIDPTFTVPNNTVRDTTVYSAKPNSSSYYSSAYNIVGNHGSGYGEGIAFVQANYNYNLQPLFTYQNIVSARYRVYEGSGKTNSSTINVGLPIDSWNQTTLNYGNKPSYTKTSSKVISKSGWHEFNITTQAKTWVQGYKTSGSLLGPANGLVLYANDPSASSKHFCSSEHSTYTPSISITYHEANMYHVNAAYGNRPFKAWGRLIDGISPVYSFNVTTAGTYRIETLDSSYFGADATSFNSRLYLYDSNHNHLVQSTGNSGNTLNQPNHEHIVRYLDVGTYHVCVASNDTYMLQVYCYLIIEKFDTGEDTTVVGNGELAGFYDTYANMCADFYKIGDADNDYNCLGYALKDAPPYDYVVSGQLWEGGSDNLSKKFPNHTLKYDYLPSTIKNCIFAYGTQSAVHHYAKMKNGIVTAKLGSKELVQHSHYNIYHHTSYSNKLLVLVNPSEQQ